MRLKTFITLAAGMMAISINAVSANGLQSSTNIQPRSINDGANLGGTTPPVCNTRTQRLHWNGNRWKCIDALTNQPDGAIVGYAIRSPSGTYPRKAGYSNLTTCSRQGGIWNPIKSASPFYTTHICLK